jgi:hypothetical protein
MRHKLAIIPKRRAERAVETAKARRTAFEEDSNVIRVMLDTIKTAENLVSAADALDAAEERFTLAFDDNNLDD